MQALADYDDLVGLDMRWRCVDGAMTKAPLGGKKTGKIPLTVLSKQRNAL
jgi:hypothetical protein